MVPTLKNWTAPRCRHDTLNGHARGVTSLSMPYPTLSKATQAGRRATEASIGLWLISAFHDWGDDDVVNHSPDNQRWLLNAVKQSARRGEFHYRHAFKMWLLPSVYVMLRQRVCGYRFSSTVVGKDRLRTLGHHQDFSSYPQNF